MSGIEHAKKSRLLVRWLPALLMVGLLLPQPADAQRRTPQKAFALSLVLPGLGHRHVQDGSWRGRATLFAGADVGLWLGLFGANWRQQQRVQSYQTLAATRAGAVIDGKDRAFYLNLATFRSSDEYLDVQLRNRAWNRVDYVSAPGFQWAWASGDDFQRFRELRDDAETLRRRRSIYVALLVANRLIAGVSAVLQSSRTEAPAMAVSLGPPPAGEVRPTVEVRMALGR